MTFQKARDAAVLRIFSVFFSVAVVLLKRRGR